MEADYPKRLLARWPFWQRVAGPTAGFSGSRLRNAAPHPGQFD